MTLRKWAVRIAYLSGGLFLSLVLLACLAVQFQQRMLRWRAERMSADMHRIRLYQSTWTDAQRLMTRWGAWGHYDGSCTAASCKYEIEIDSISHNNPRISRHLWLDWLLMHDRFNFYQWFGGRSSAFYTSFTVHNGFIWRESSWIGVSIPRRKIRLDNDFDWSLSLGAVSRQRLRRTIGEFGAFMASSEDELAQHPYYKVGRPDGCKINCKIGVVYFSTHTPSGEIERLTSYDFSCFTRFTPCVELEDLLPAAKEWHLYKEDQYPSSETPCESIPVWVRARDARYIMAVEALSTKIVKAHEDYGEYHREVARVRVVRSLKAPAPWLPGAIVSAHLLNWLNGASPSFEEEHWLPGKRYIVFAIGNDQRDQNVTKDSPLTFERCGVQEDTPEIRHELEKGFAQNDTLNP